MLRIVPASEPITIDNIVLTAYAAPGYGKTSLAFTADKPLLLDFDKGSHRASVRGDSVQVSCWADIASMTPEDLASYSTIVVDTAGRALDALAADIITGNPKAGRGDGSLTLQGFGTLKSRFAQWVSFLQSIKKDIVLVAHMDEQKNGDDVMERIDAQGASRNEIYKKSDAMCRIRLDGKDARYLDFDPRQGGFGKNPAQLPKIAFPDPKQNPRVLADVIAQIKSSINAMTEVQSATVKEEEIAAQSAKDATTVDEFNLLLKIAKEQGKLMIRRKIIEESAKAKGFVFEKGVGFVAPKMEEVAA